MSEHKEHARVIEQLEARCSEDATWWAFPRGLAPIARKNIRHQGWRFGVPGLCFIKSGEPLFIDMKRDVVANTGYNIVSDEQIKLHREITDAGGRVAICFGADEAIKQLEDWDILEASE